MKLHGLLFEIGAEEIPAAFVPRALSSLEAILRKRLDAARLGCAGIRAVGTPRRLVLIAEGIPDVQEDCVVEVKGPQKKAAFDEAGKPTKTLEGFAKAQGVPVEEIKTVKTEKGEYVLATKRIKGVKTITLLPEMLKAVITENVFPKSMRWASFDVSFARPVHWIVALFGDESVDVEFGHVKSAGHTFGHRFLSAGPLKVSSIQDYLDALKKNFVVLDPEDRRRIIKEGLTAVAKEAGGELLPDDGLLEEVCFLVEYPVVLKGSFDREFLTLPRDVVINAMREHQRYFSVVDKSGGLLPFFITVANTKATDMDIIRKGNERVLRARLNDAKFYFEKDIKTTLAQKALLLKGVVFQAKLGTSYEKVERFTELAVITGSKAGFSRPFDDGERPADFLTQSLNPAAYDSSKIDAGLYSKYILGRAAMLAKADLVSGMVGEFPKLQGIMGSVYARKDNETPEVATAIFEHYLPAISGGVLPVSVPGAIISIADKLDTIAGCFSVGLIPTGAQDPYALRRQALGIIAIMLDKNFTFRLDGIVDAAIGLLKNKLKRNAEDVRNDILEFFKERLRNQLLNQGLAFDSIDAVLATEWFDIPDAVKRVRAIEAFKTHPACPNLVVAFKRVSNILKHMEFKDERPDAGLLTDPHEKALFEAVSKIEPVIQKLLLDADYKGVFETLASIKDRIDTFFDKCLVMAQDENTKRNRLVLLDSIRRLYFKTADISRLTVTV
ncbi:MAG: glycine--tRNA ligase subunit beta [Deltaproteobacteria bacterium]|nr:glycine--tRNA ligase subunit beta [Deltaproteobacteria bacterium]